MCNVLTCFSKVQRLCLPRSLPVISAPCCCCCFSLRTPHSARVAPKLACAQGTPEADSDSGSSRVVRALYEALRKRDAGTVHRIVAPDLEWWFHGPPTHQFLMRLLTGTASSDDDRFEFVPESVTSLGPIVIAEGCDRSRSIYWAHACTVTDGVITQVREYFNTSLTVTRLGTDSLPDIVDASSSQPHCTSVWESSLSGQAGKSVPGLLLAI